MWTLHRKGYKNLLQCETTKQTNNRVKFEYVGIFANEQIIYLPPFLFQSYKRE